MSLILEIDNNGRPHQEFSTLRDELLSKGETLANHLDQVHYSQLSLCSIANAGAVRCDATLVQQERASRRRRFLSMDYQQLVSCRRYLEAQGMYADVLEEIHLSRAISWAELSNLHKLYFKLVCLYNHLDLPHYRYEEALELMRRMIADREWSGREAMRGLQALYRLKASDEHINPLEDVRMVIGGLVEELYLQLSEEQRVIAQTEVLRGYQCTCGCFQPHARIDAS